MQVEPLRKLLREALKYRNQVVALEYWMAFHGLERILPHLHVSTLNTEHLDDYFFHAYLQPQIEAVTTPLQTMKPLERAYFCRMMRFVMREQIVAKVGAQEGVGSAGADLWNMPLSMKRETGNIFTRLRIVDKNRMAREATTPSRSLSPNKRTTSCLTSDVETWSISTPTPKTRLQT